MFIYYLILLTVFLIYLAIYSKSFFASRFNKEAKDNIFYSICTILLTLMMGLRADTVGVDLMQYRYRYEHYLYMIRYKIFISEFGFNSFNFILNHIGVSWRLYVFITSFIISFIFLRFLKKYSNSPYLSFFLFITIGNLDMLMSGIRQSLAVSFCLISFMLIESEKFNDNKVFRSLLSVSFFLLAISFHNSAIIFSIYYILKIFRLKISQAKLYILTIIAMLSLFYGRMLLLFSSAIIPSKYANLNLTEIYNKNPLVILISIVITFFCIFTYKPNSFKETTNEKKVKKETKNSNIDDTVSTNSNTRQSITSETATMVADNGNDEIQSGNTILVKNTYKCYDEITTIFFIFSILNILFTCLSINQNQISRLSYYFTISNIILIVNSITNIKYKNRIIVTAVIVFLCLAYFHLGISGGTLKIDNYLFFWQV